MGDTGYLFNDYIKDVTATDISITSEDDDWPTENSQNENVAITTKTDGVTANVKYRVKMGSSVVPRIFMLLNHNLTGGTYDVNSYTAGDYSTGKITVINDASFRLLDTYEYISVPASRQYWEWDLTNATTGDGYIQLGRVMAYSDLVAFTDVEDWEQTRGFGFKNIINETLHGIRYVHKLYAEREEYLIRWKTRTAANLPTELRTLFSDIYGNAHPFAFIPDIAETPLYYVYSKAARLEWTRFTGSGSSDIVTGFQLPMIEAVRNKPAAG